MTSSDQRAQAIVDKKKVTKDGIIRRAIKEKLILTCEVERNQVKLEPHVYGLQSGSSGIFAYVIKDEKVAGYTDIADAPSNAVIADAPSDAVIADSPKVVEDIEKVTPKDTKVPELAEGLQRLYFFEIQNIKLTDETFEIRDISSDSIWDEVLTKVE